MCTHNLCFERKYENSQKNSTENFHFYCSEKSLYVAWACFRNGMKCLLRPVLSAKCIRCVFCILLKILHFTIQE